MPGTIVRFGLVIGIVVGWEATTTAAFLSPSDFASLGSFPTTTGAYAINTSGFDRGMM